MKTIDCGTVLNTHGIRGELKIASLLDSGVLEALPELFINGQKYSVLAARAHKGHVLLTLDGVDSVELAMALKGKPVTCDRELIALPEGGYFFGDIYGFEVFDLRVGRAVGTLKEVRESPAGMLYLVQDAEREFLIPAVDAFKRGIDFSARRVTVETIPGMLPDED